MKGSDDIWMFLVFFVILPIIIASGVLSPHASINDTSSVPLPDSVTVSLFYGYNNELDRTESWNVTETESFEWGNCHASVSDRSSQLFIGLHEDGITSWDANINSSTLPIFLNTYKCSIKVE